MLAGLRVVALYLGHPVAAQRSDMPKRRPSAVPDKGTPQRRPVPVPRRRAGLHLDLLSDGRAADVARAESLGARRVDIGQGEPGWVVLADPQGNEFCILRPPSTASANLST